MTAIKELKKLRTSLEAVRHDIITDAELKGDDRFVKGYLQANTFACTLVRELLEKCEKEQEGRKK